MRLHRHFFEGYFNHCEEYILSYSHSTLHYKKGDLLFHDIGLEGGKNIYYYIKSGYTIAHSTTENGATKILCYYASGTFPNVDLIEEAFSTYASEVVEALTDTTVLVFEQDTIAEMLKNSFDFTKALLNFSSEIIALLSYQAMVLPNLSAEVRLCDFLYLSYRFAPSVQKHKPESVFASQEQIAQYIGVTRTQVTRLLKTLKEENLIETRRGYIRMLDVPAIRKKCSSTILITE